MDRQYMLRVADAVEALGRGEKVGPLTGFTMAKYVNSCGTAGCIAGTVCALLVADGELDGMPRRNIDQIAADRLELTRTEADALFLGHWHPSFHEDFECSRLSRITAFEAAAELRRLAEEPA